MSIANHPTGAPERAALRRLKALDLRIEGKSMRAIAAALGVSVGQAHKDLMVALDAVAVRERERAHLWRTEEIAKLDALEEAVLPLALKGRPDCVDRALRIMERRARLLGLDAPAKVAATDPTGEHPAIVMQIVRDQPPGQQDASATARPNGHTHVPAAAQTG